MGVQKISQWGGIHKSRHGHTGCDSSSTESARMPVASRARGPDVELEIMLCLLYLSSAILSFMKLPKRCFQLVGACSISKKFWALI